MPQFVSSSDSMEPSSPNKAPEAHTEIVFFKRRAERTLPPNPVRRYTTPTRTDDKEEMVGPRKIGFKYKPRTTQY